VAERHRQVPHAPAHWEIPIAGKSFFIVGYGSRIGQPPVSSSPSRGSQLLAMPRGHLGSHLLRIERSLVAPNQVFVKGVLHIREVRATVSRDGRLVFGEQ